MAALQHPNVDAFEVYFKRADLDQDGRINGSEAVAFFKGSNLPQPVLAQIWKYSDQSNNGFLGRLEFYNALRLVTVAQSGRELTPDIVKAALFSSASAKIPAPKISFVQSPATLMNPSVTVRAQSGSTLLAPTHIGVANPIGQTSVPRGILPGFDVNQPVIPPSNSHPARPPSTTPYPAQGVNQTPTGATFFSGLSQISSSSSKPADWFGMSSGVSVSGTLQGPVIPSSTKQDGFRPTSVAGTTTGLAIKSPMLSVEATSTSSSVLDAKDLNSLAVSGNGFSSDFTFGGDAFSANSQAKQDGISNASIYSTGTHSSLGIVSTTAAFLNSKIGTLDSSQNTFMRSLGSNQPLGAQSTVQKNILDPIQNSLAEIPNSTSQPQPPWPRINQTDIQRYTKVFVEVDKDRDGKISGEQARNLFLSWRLSREVLKQVWDLADQDSDGMLSLREFCIAVYMMERYREGRPLPASLPKVLSLDETLLQATGQPLAPYGDPTWRPGLSQGIPGPNPPVPITGIRPPMQSIVTYQVDGASLPSQHKLMASFPRNMENQQNVNHTLEEITNAQKKPKEVENKILDSKEKVEYYRTKMQELVLYKSRCDNKLFEITERASSDKLEVESLAKKYEEKYKQVSEVASKLTMEEAAFRDMQGRKLELQNALVHMEKGGSSDGLLQVRADRIQSDLEELVKILQERCKHHGLDVKSKTTIELPFGWQPGIQQGAIDWDEDWDKFEDEGFSVAKDHLSVEVGSNPEPLVWEDKPSTVRIPPASPDSVVDDRIHENDSAVFDAQSDGYGSAKSPSGSPGKYPFEVHHYDDMSDIPGDKFTGDEQSWGAAFDGNDDIDSVWNKGGDIEEDKKSPFFDSVPSTPHQLSKGTEELSFFNDFGHLDSPKRESHARFDSVSEGYSFDDSDPFGVGLFKPSNDGGDHSSAAKDFSF